MRHKISSAVLLRCNSIDAAPPVKEHHGSTPGTSARIGNQPGFLLRVSFFAAVSLREERFIEKAKRIIAPGSLAAVGHVSSGSGAAARAKGGGRAKLASAEFEQARGAMVSLAPGLLMAAALLLSTAATMAQSGAGDVRYCNALAELYTRYVGTAGFTSRRSGGFDPEGQRAIDKCRSNPQSAIPVLEKRLRNARVSLPSRG
jgi:hypothetical protein